MDQSDRIRLIRTPDRPRIYFKIRPELNSWMVSRLCKFVGSYWLVLFRNKLFICLAVLVSTLVGWSIVRIGVSGSEIANWALVALAHTLYQRILISLWHLMGLNCLLFVLHNWRARLLIDLLSRGVADPVTRAIGEI